MHGRELVGKGPAVADTLTSLEIRSIFNDRWMIVQDWSRKSIRNIIYRPTKFQEVNNICIRIMRECFPLNGNLQLGKHW